MADWTVHLEFEEGTSSKFWRARTEGQTLYVNYGKIGSAGQTQVKDFGDAASATKEYNKLVAEKRKKGYSDVAGGAAAPDDDDDDDDDLDAADGDGDGDDEDDAPPPKSKPAAAPAPKPAAASGRPANATKLVLDAGARKVETYVWIDGTTVHMDSVETYATPDAAKKSFERLKKALGGEGYK
jgi:predicted DNA-binding WGR domain protein